MKYQAKGGVYCIQFPYDKLKYPEFSVLKKGHSKSLKKRFATYNTSISDPEDYVQHHLKYILHSPFNAFSGTGILEKLLHTFFQEFRMNPKKEFFKFPEKTFNIDTYTENILSYFALHNITDISLYKSIEDTPYTNIPPSYDPSLLDPEPEHKLNSLIPKKYQVPVIEAVVEHFQTNYQGGLYLPPGHGKTFIATISCIKMGLGSILVLTPRLSICTEWEKCFSGTTYPIYVINSETTDTFPTNGKSVVISTYQSYIKNPELYTEYDLIIYDEAHHIMTDNNYSKSLNISGKKLFLTATPELHCLDSQEENVISTYLDKETFGNTIYTESLHSSIEKGILTDYRIVVHNKKSCTDCTEHVHDLTKKYGVKKLVIFFNTRESAKEACTFLKKDGFTTYYVDGETKKKERELVFKKFAKDETAVLVNIDVVSEGVSIPEIDGILMMDARFSQKVLIQILGRGLRLSKGKENCIFCVPMDCLETLEVCLSGLVYDSGGGTNGSIRGRIITEVKDVEERDEIIKWVDRKLVLIEIGRSGSSIGDYMIGLLNEEVNRTKKLVKVFFEGKNKESIGQFQNTILGTLSRRKQQSHKDKIPVWEEKYPYLFSLLRERAKEIEEKRETKVEITVEDKIKLLSEIVEENGKLVSVKYKGTNGENFGNFQTTILSTLSGGKRQHHKDKIPEWEEKYPYLFSLLRERVKEIEEKRETKVENSPDDMVKLLSEIVEKNEKLLRVSSTGVNGENIGNFQVNILSTLSGKRQYHKDKIPVWEEKYPYLFSLLRERVNEIEEKRETKMENNPDDMVKLLSEIVEKNGKLVSVKYTGVNGENIGNFQSRIFCTLSGGKQSHKDKIPVWEEKYPYLFSLLRERVKKIEEKRETKVEITAEDKIKLLSKIVLEKNDLVPKIYKGKNRENIGNFQGLILRTLSGGKQQSHKDKIPVWEEKYPYLFSLLRERVKKIEKNRS